MSSYADDEHVGVTVERLQHEPALRGLVLTAPTRALATLGVSLDDLELVQLLEEIDAMDRPTHLVTVAAREVDRRGWLKTAFPASPSWRRMTVLRACWELSRQVTLGARGPGQ